MIKVMKEKFKMFLGDTKASKDKGEKPLSFLLSICFFGLIIVGFFSQFYEKNIAKEEANINSNLIKLLKEAEALNEE